jgi:succinyl-diaminopimelate desuccinylase
LPPKLTVTAIRGGEGYSIVPDRCNLLVDVRLTPAFPTTAAEGLLARLTADVDRTWPTARATTIAPAESWPAYRLPARSALVEALATAASAEGGQPVEPKVTGPSNIGNYLAALGIEATCGYGVSYRNLHATDECIDVRTVAPVHRAYRAACRSFLGDWRGSPVR